MLSDAYKHRRIPVNLSITVAAPKADTREARFLSVEEVLTLAEALQLKTPFDLLVGLAAFTGLRIGEVAVPRVRDIDLRVGEVQVRLNRTCTSIGYTIGPPKIRADKRDVPILDETLFRDLSPHLRNHLHLDNLEAGLWLGKAPGHSRISYDHAFDPKLFCRNDFKPACKRVRLDVLVFHELSHTSATLSLESRALSVYELSVAMGHEPESTTNKVYAHLRKKDYSIHRASFSAHVVASSAAPAPIRSIS